jgi:DNA-binding PadR family transcriptional regulator
MQEIRRGHLKFYILRLLSEGHRTGYGLMKAIETETGFWRPSAGSLYPLLASMRDAGLIREVEESDGTTRWQITAAGKASYAQAEESKRELLDSMRRSLVVFAKVFDAAPLESLAERLSAWQQGRSDFRTLGPLFMDLHDALWALPPLRPDQEDRVREVLTRAIHELESVSGTDDAAEDPTSSASS